MHAGVQAVDRSGVRAGVAGGAGRRPGARRLHGPRCKGTPATWPNWPCISNSFLHHPATTNHAFPRRLCECECVRPVCHAPAVADASRAECTRGLRVQSRVSVPFRFTTRASFCDWHVGTLAEERRRCVAVESWDGADGDETGQFGDSVGEETPNSYTTSRLPPPLAVGKKKSHHHHRRHRWHSGMAFNTHPRRRPAGRRPPCEDEIISSWGITGAFPHGVARLRTRRRRHCHVGTRAHRALGWSARSAPKPEPLDSFNKHVGQPYSVAAVGARRG
jgi:hypothetical protein